MKKCISYFMTKKECLVFDEINIQFAKGEFGREHFNCNDIIVEYEEFCEFFDFIEDCVISTAALELGFTKGGWLQINNTVSPNSLGSGRNRVMTCAAALRSIRMLIRYRRATSVPTV